MVVVVLTLPHWDQISADVLSTTAAMWSSGAIRGEKMWRWEMYAASSRSLMVNITFGLFSVRMWSRMAVMNISRNTCHYPDGLYQTPPIPVREASVAPIHMGGCGLIYLRCIGLVTNDATRWLHNVSYSWTGVDRFIRWPLAILSVCWRH